jgi:glycolate oxidase iron-sulfur subunit
LHNLNLSASLLEQTGRCVACGLCLPHCPTYRKTQSEADSPRGRILLTQAVVQGVLPMNEKYMAHIDLCLTCRSCETACPNHVPYGEIVDLARAMISEKRPLTLSQRIAGRLAANPVWWRIGGMSLCFANLLGLNKLIPAIPTVERQYRFKTRYDAAKSIGDVSLFLGCATSALDAQTLAASIFVLNRLGYTVHIPSEQTCCGGLHLQAGDKASADALEQRNKAAFGEMPILAVASGCGARLIETMPDRVQDISAFLAKASGWDNVAIAPLAATIAVQDPCSLRNGLKAEKHPYTLLKRIPSADVKPLPGNAQCCGGAGSYMLMQPDMANRLRDDKISACQTINPQYLATSNISCALHLAKGLGDNVKIAHPVWIVAQQMGFEGTL